ncbi:hypothetical protein CRG98_040406 [Punica granatum]|uniref:Uncharacterized protein n=1 Tax=Punica granatum TaxID=22663 RepID=A0A2I0I6A2_PUNGR|nr:hypothetical protein CRG98_040406 [Punica granatum]
MEIQVFQDHKTISSACVLFILDEVAGILRGYWLPRWRGRGRELAALTLNRSRISDLKSPVDSGLGLSIGDPDPDPSIEVVSVLRGYRQPRRRGHGCRLAAPTPLLFRFSL